MKEFLFLVGYLLPLFWFYDEIRESLFPRWHLKHVKRIQTTAQ
jgi:hypothetical protein